MTFPVSKPNRKQYLKEYYDENQAKIKEYYKKRYWDKNLYGKIKNNQKNIFKINKKSFTINFD